MSIQHNVNKSGAEKLGPAPQTAIQDRAARVLANSIFKHLQSEGCQPKDIISVSTQLLDLVAGELKKDATS